MKMYKSKNSFYSTNIKPPNDTDVSIVIGDTICKVGKSLEI